MPLPNVPGVDVVGKIYRIDSISSEKYNLKTGDRVLGLCKWGGNSRYLAVDPSRVVKVPDALDPAVAVCLVEAYLSAFQLLNWATSRHRRYVKGTLKGKTFLILGTLDANTGRALAELADYAGVVNLFATAEAERLDQLESVGIAPLDKQNLDWFERLKDC